MSREDIPDQSDERFGTVTRRNALKVGAAMTGGLALGGTATGTALGDFDEIELPGSDTELFLKLDGINGESEDHVHEDAMDVVAWRWGAATTGDMHVARGGGAGRPAFRNITVTKFIDAATPVLWQHLATGRHIPRGELILRRAGGDPVEFLKIELENILVSGLDTGGAAGKQPGELVTLNFARWNVIYTPQQADGTPGAEIEFGFDIPRNEPA